MALSEFEIKRCEKLLGAYLEKHRPPVEIRNELDLGYRMEGQSIEIFEIRPAWRRPEIKIEDSVAKATYVKTDKIWKIFWKRADSKWHRYQPAPQVKTLEGFLAVVEKDEFGCFFG
ncbi:MAG TPA: DUF3024 domain-containing protein [Geobacteraceae bacterium]|nr:DUF3024 domain-containing protein [Geobacteraceae bacterium]